MLVRALLLLFLLAISPVQASWEQARGEADRSATFPALPGTLDVIEFHALADEDSEILGWRSLTLAAWSGGVASLLVHRTAETCSLLHGPLHDTQRTTLHGCVRGRLQAMPADGPIVCMDHATGTGTIVKFDLEGNEQWRIDPAVDLQRLGLPVGHWTCEGASIDAQLVVPFVGVREGGEPPVHIIAALDPVTGARAWESRVTIPGTGAALESEGLVFIPHGVSSNDLGHAVVGHVVCPQNVACPSTVDGPQGHRGAVAWFDLQGVQRGLLIAEPAVDATLGASPVKPVPHVSTWAAGDDGMFAVVAGPRSVFIDPTSNEVVDGPPTVHRSSDDAIAQWPAPLWQSQRVALPSDKEIIFAHPVNQRETQQPWAAPGGVDRIVDLVGDSVDNLYILTARIQDPSATPGVIVGDEASITILDSGGRTLHELPIRAASLIGTAPIFVPDRVQEPQHAYIRVPQFVALDRGLAIVDAMGGVAVLGVQDAGPVVDIDTLFPDPGHAFEVSVRHTEGVAAATVRWGDLDRHATRASFVDGTDLHFSHIYAQAERYDLVVSVLYEDGTTRTTSFVVDVGGAQAELSPIQRAFSDEYEDTTWGIIGLTIALLGGLYGWVRLRRRHGQLRRALRDMRRIVDGADPTEALVALQALRSSVHERAVSGHFDSSQWHTFDSQAALAGRRLMYRLIRPFQNRLEPTYQTMLAGFFRDGRVTPEEAELAMTELTRQASLDDAERGVLRSIFENLANA